MERLDAGMLLLEANYVYLTIEQKALQNTQAFLHSLAPYIICFKLVTSEGFNEKNSNLKKVI